MHMIRSALAVAVVAMAVAAVAAAGLDGTWAFAFRAEWAPPELACTFTLKEAALSGTCGSRGRSVQIIDAKSDGTALQWTVRVPTGRSGAIVAYTFNGTLDAQSDTISGTLTETDVSGTTAPRDTPFTAHRE
jgi:hypothetical protein